MERFAAAGRHSPGSRRSTRCVTPSPARCSASRSGKRGRRFDKGVQAMRAAVEDDLFAEWEDTPPEVYIFEDV
jgi:hypothetical protein